MAIRYSDMKLTESGAYDFVARERTPTFQQIALILASAALIAIGVVLSAHSKAVLIFNVCSIFIIIGVYVIYQLTRSRDALLATEFQNALFASAMGLHNKFCLIIKRDGIMIYIDRAFQTLFPDFITQPIRNIDALLKHGKVPASESERIMDAIDRGVFDKVMLNIIDAQGMMHHIILSIEPILRPAGFVMLRGREYIENRSTPNEPLRSSPRLFDKSSITLFSSVMENMKMGLYMASPKGDLIYCNLLLEEWLGYNEGEMVARNLTISNILPPERNPNIPKEAGDAEGNVRIARKVGGFIKAFLNQKPIKDDSGNIVGYTALVHLTHREENNSIKNKESF